MAKSHGSYAEENTSSLCRVSSNARDWQITRQEISKTMKMESRMTRNCQVRFGGGVTGYPENQEATLPILPRLRYPSAERFMNLSRAFTRTRSMTV